MRTIVRVLLLIMCVISFAWGVWVLATGIAAVAGMVSFTGSQPPPLTGPLDGWERFMDMNTASVFALPAFASLGFSVLCWIGYCVTLQTSPSKQSGFAVLPPHA